VDQITPLSINAKRAAGRTLSPRTEGMLFGGLGVLAFSLTMPATRAAAPELGGVFVGLGRSVVAAVLAGALLLCLRESLPARRHWMGLALVALGAVVGFPLCSALAMQSLPSAHGAVATGLLPAATAVMSVLRAGERPSKLFWLGCLTGVLAVLAFAIAEGAGRPQPGDLLLLLAVALGALGYAEGGRLAREMNGWRVICWALVLVAPLLLIPILFTVTKHGVHASPRAWIGFGYVSVVSAFLGFFAWYRGLAVGGVARVGQIQLVQPVLTLGWATLLLAEPLRLPSLLASLTLIGVALCTQRLRAPTRPL
jgi:drug/metabolite transporter (DMT)-like permease